MSRNTVKFPILLETCIPKGYPLDGCVKVTIEYDNPVLTFQPFKIRTTDATGFRSGVSTDSMADAVAIRDRKMETLSAAVA